MLRPCPAGTGAAAGFAHLLPSRAAGKGIRIIASALGDGVKPLPEINARLIPPPGWEPRLAFLAFLPQVVNNCRPGAAFEVAAHVRDQWRQWKRNRIVNCKPPGGC